MFINYTMKFNHKTKNIPFDTTTPNRQAIIVNGSLGEGVNRSNVKKKEPSIPSVRTTPVRKSTDGENYNQE